MRPRSGSLERRGKTDVLSRLRISHVATLAALVLPVSGQIEASIPSTWVIVSDTFDSGSISSWTATDPGGIVLNSASAYAGSYGVEVDVGASETHIWQGDLARAPEGYLSFWFDPTTVSIPAGASNGFVPQRSITIAAMRGPTGGNTVALRMWQSPTGYRAYLQWTQADGSWRQDYGGGEFALNGGWQRITIGFRIDTFVAAWVGGVEKRRVTGVTHRDPYGNQMIVGKVGVSTTTSPTGSIRFDEISFSQLDVSDVWVDAVSGSDSNDGLTPGTAFRTIAAASNWAGPGTVVHILPGVYRETLVPALNGTVSSPVTFRAENGLNTVFIRGSEASSSVAWTQLSSNTIGLPPGVSPSSIWWADLGPWGLPRDPLILAHVDPATTPPTLTRLPRAREPDEKVGAAWKHHEFWWAADGGSTVASCFPPTDPDPDNCDLASRSTTQLTDSTTDTDPPGVETGNLKTLGNIVGAELFALDCVQGNTVYRAKVVGHDTAAGRITVGSSLTHPGSATGAIGWGTKYYVVAHPRLLDSPGEWWFDASASRLYLYPPNSGNPSSQPLEITRRDNVVDFTKRSFIRLENLNLELASAAVVKQALVNDTSTDGNSIAGCNIRFGEIGIEINQVPSISRTTTDGFRISQSEISNAEAQGIYVFYGWGSTSDPGAFVEPGVTGIVIQDSHIHDTGFRPLRRNNANPNGVFVARADNLRFERNTVERTAASGVYFPWSVIDSSATWGFSPSEILTGNILVAGNTIQSACQLTGDCGALRFWGRPPDTHVFRNVLIYGNTLRDTFGWVWVAEKRGKWTAGTVSGMSGSGLYFDTVAGFHTYRNTSYNNPLCGFRLAKNWRDGLHLIYNNISANSLYGFYNDSPALDLHPPVGLEVRNNILVNHEGYGHVFFDQDGAFSNVSLDRDLYYLTGWNASSFFKEGLIAVWETVPNIYLQTLAEAQSQFGWETAGLVTAPAFVAYDSSDHDPFDGSRPDFRLSDASPAIDAGTSSLPPSLSALLSSFGVFDAPMSGASWDIGPHEASAGTVIIRKATLPSGDPTTFTFSGDLSGNMTDGQQLSLSGGPGAYSCTETVPSGWVLQSIECDDSNSAGDPTTATATVQLDGAETVTCLFANCATSVMSLKTIEGVTFTGPEAESEVACDTLAAGGVTITGTANVSFQAGRRINLGDGFRVLSGGKFRTTIVRRP